MENSIFEELCKVLGEQKITKNEPMSNHTTFKIGGKADFFARVTTICELQETINIAKKYNLPITVIGNGSNILVRDNGIRGIVIQIGIENYNISSDIVTVGAGVKLSALAQKLLKEGITGFEFASGIPGTIGGAVKMNAGAYGKEMCNIVENTKYLDTTNNEIKELNNNEQEFEYRNSIFSKHKEYIILETVLKLQKGKQEEIKEKMQEYMDKRKQTQPIQYPNAGSTFKRGNGYITAKLIDESGLKGYSFGGAQVSSLHAGFIINKGNATAEDVLQLIKHIQNTVYEKFNINIDLEIEVIGE